MPTKIHAALAFLIDPAELNSLVGGDKTFGGGFWSCLEKHTNWSSNLIWLGKLCFFRFNALKQCLRNPYDLFVWFSLRQRKQFHFKRICPVLEVRSSSNLRPNPVSNSVDTSFHRQMFPFKFWGGKRRWNRWKIELIGEIQFVDKHSRECLRALLEVSHFNLLWIFHQFVSLEGLIKSLVWDEGAIGGNRGRFNFANVMNFFLLLLALSGLKLKRSVILLALSRVSVLPPNWLMARTRRSCRMLSEAWCEAIARECVRTGISWRGIIINNFASLLPENMAKYGGSYVLGT